MEAKAIHDFNATADDELSFKKNNTIKVLSFEDDKNWYKAELNGKEGYVPFNYIEMKPHKWFVRAMSRSGAEQLLMEKQGGKYIHPDGAFLVRNSESTHGDFSLSVKFQDNVQHFKVLKDGFGKYFLWVVKFCSINELIDYHRTSSISRSQTICLKNMANIDDNQQDMQSRQPEERRVCCMYDFTPEDASELEFSKGDHITIVEEVDSHWCKGINLRTQKTGLFPITYVRKINS